MNETKTNKSNYPKTEWTKERNNHQIPTNKTYETNNKLTLVVEGPCSLEASMACRRHTQHREDNNDEDSVSDDKNEGHNHTGMRRNEMEKSKDGKNDDNDSQTEKWEQRERFILMKQVMGKSENQNLKSDPL